MLRTFFVSIFLLAGILCVWATERTVHIDKRYLNLPVVENGDRHLLSFRLGSQLLTKCDIRLARAGEEPKYWMFYDVQAYQGKTLTLVYEGEAGCLEGITQSDEWKGQENVYTEAYRPQFHFSTRRGWINDPNGLVYYDGEYHLFYQHNPFGVEWGNLNWGHAVSRDLVHWEELPEALQMDADGEMYSGSAVVDYNNVSGLGSRENPAMLAFYTLQARHGQVQCLAYSLDKGRTWTKYAKNPIIDTAMKGGTWHNRDPKVFWYAPGRHWVMVLHEKDGHSIYNSTNLTDWTWTSHTPGFWECPELFELPVDGDPNHTKWVMSGASGTYMIGSFDGKRFTPEAGKYYYATGYLYAPQTINNIPAKDGRRIQISWASIRHQDMPFTGMMLMPVELKLVTTKDGIRLTALPVKEVEQLLTPVFKADSLTMDEANEKLKGIATDGKGLCVKATIRLTHPTNAGLELDGHRILDYDMNFNRINGIPYSPDDFTSLRLSFDLYIDRNSIEAFFDGGRYSFTNDRKAPKGERRLKFWSLEDLAVESLEVYTVDSIWQDSLSPR